MRRVTLLAIAAATLALSVAWAGSAGASGRPARVLVRHTALGNLLANGRGFTLYVFTRDGRRHDSCVTVSHCTGIWPVLATGAKPLPGAGVKGSLLGSIRLPGGGRQVTYAGRPLYTYVADGGPGQTFYVGVSQFGGTWYGISPAGRIVR